MEISEFPFSVFMCLCLFQSYDGHSKPRATYFRLVDGFRLWNFFHMMTDLICFVRI
jgi:hypothetical protein